MTQSKNPLKADNLAAEASRGFDNTDRLNARLDRYSTAKKRALVNLKELTNLQPLDDLLKERYRVAAAKLESCGNYLEFRNYYTVGKTRLTKASFCKQHLLCPLCAIRRGAKTLEAYLARYRVVKDENPSWRLSMLTLTVANGEDLAERFQHLHNSIKRVFKRRRDYLDKQRGLTEWRKVYGWVGTYEVTNKGN